MKCYICGSEMDEVAAFCPKCGTKNPHASEIMKTNMVSNTFNNTEVQADDRTVLLPSGNAGMPSDDRTVLLPSGNARMPSDDRTVLLPSGNAGVPSDDRTVLLQSGNTGMPSDDRTVLLPSGNTGMPSDDRTVLLPSGNTGLPSDDRTVLLPQQGQPPISQQAAIPNTPAQNSRQQTVKKRKKSPVKRSKAPIIVFFIVLAAAVGAAFFLLNPNKEDTLEILSQADAYYDSGDYSAAEAEYDRVLLSDPLNEAAYLGKAKSLVSREKRSEAIEVLSEGYSKTGSGKIWDYLQQLKQEERLEK